MYIYDIAAVMLVGLSHVFLYFQLIRYHRMSYSMIVTLSIIFTILLGMAVTVTGYPELNIVMLLLFLLSLGLMKRDLTWQQNLYFALVSMVMITLIKTVLMELGLKLFMLTPFNLYLHTFSLIHLMVSVVIMIGIILLRQKIQAMAKYVIGSSLYYVSYVLLAAGLIIELILTMPATPFLAELHQTYGQISYAAAFILFFILLLIVLIGSHLSKEKMAEEQQERLDDELLNYVERLEQMHGELVGFRHDYTNILLALDEGIRRKDMEQIEHVYDEVIAPTSELMNHQALDMVKLASINVSEVKSMLSVKVREAMQQQIHVTMDIPEKINDIGMSIVPFIRAISILVDNAIEEAKLSHEKTLQLAFFEINDVQYFIVRNSCRQDVVDLQAIFEKNYSSKQGNTGYGLFSLKNIINQTDHVTLETNFIAPYFTQTFILKKT